MGHSAARLALILLCSVASAMAGTPRFQSGQGWGVPPGVTVLWGTTNLQYFTDPGPLNASVSHTQADRMVAAAAAVWNAPTSTLSLSQGGVLAEDVDATDVTFDGQQFVFPADVQMANEGNIPVAIVYDTDGSLIDLLLGVGASEPDGCRQNAVVGDVDDIHHDDGQIHHATLILNGRCVGSTPEQLLEMQYQLARTFGRVLGLSWSQTNDDVFTEQTPATASQMANWPLMHPMDLICGDYAYQCMTNPFTLRPDDLNTLALLYPVSMGTQTPGKQPVDADAMFIWGLMFFPTGQGMDWVNITTRHWQGDYTDAWQTTSGSTGYNYQQAIATPVNHTPAINSGTGDAGVEGYYLFRRIPLNGIANIWFDTEPINPLYTGDYAIGPYIRPPATPSGSPVDSLTQFNYSRGDIVVFGEIMASDAASRPFLGIEGTESMPAPFDPTGWQIGLLGQWGHNSWFNVSAAAGHSWTLEVTALDENGAATPNKAQPVMGVWKSTDTTGTLPTVNSQTTPFNSMSLGMTQLHMHPTRAGGSYRLSISDQFGAGRPDFGYEARLLYITTVSPATVSSGGGQITLTGTGFSQGAQVTVNGAPANVVSVSSTEIVADAPTLAAAGTQAGTPVTVTVTDPDTAGTASVLKAVSYVVLPNRLLLVSQPGALETGIPSAQPLTLRVTANDGLSPVPNASVVLAVTAGSVQLGSCSATPCTLQTDSNGQVSISLTGQEAGLVTLTATEASGGASLQVSFTDTDPVRSLSIGTPQLYLAQGAGGTWNLQVLALQDTSPAEGVMVSATADAGLSLSTASASTGADGTLRLSVTAAASASTGASTVTACAWSGVCTPWTLHVVDPSAWQVVPVASTVANAPVQGSLQTLRVSVTDGQGHALQGAPVEVHQRVLAWEGTCTAAEGRCPAAPVLAASDATLVSDANGEVAVTPLEVPGVPQTVQIALSTGTQGFATVTLAKTP